MNKKLSSRCFALVATIVSATTAHAQYYGGVSLGATSGASGFISAARSTGFGVDGDAFTPTALLTILPATGLQLSNEPSLGMKLGYRFNPYVALESRYITSASSSFGRDVAQFSHFSKATRREQSIGLDLVGNVSLMKKLSLEGRAGLRSETTLFSNAYTSALPTTSGVMGLSLNYNVNSSLGLRFEVERSRKFFNERFAGEADSAVSFGVLWRF
jgi:hypothetical protein